VNGSLPEGVSPLQGNKSALKWAGDGLEALHRVDGLNVSPCTRDVVVLRTEATVIKDCAGNAPHVGKLRLEGKW
jgi:hypothetical protein